MRKRKFQIIVNDRSAVLVYPKCRIKFQTSKLRDSPGMRHMESKVRIWRMDQVELWLDDGGEKGGNRERERARGCMGGRMRIPQNVGSPSHPRRLWMFSYRRCVAGVSPLSSLARAITNASQIIALSDSPRTKKYPFPVSPLRHDDNNEGIRGTASGAEQRGAIVRSHQHT